MKLKVKGHGSWFPKSFQLPHLLLTVRGRECLALFVASKAPGSIHTTQTLKAYSGGLQWSSNLQSESQQQGAHKEDTDFFFYPSLLLEDWLPPLETETQAAIRSESPAGPWPPLRSPRIPGSSAFDMLCIVIVRGDLEEAQEGPDSWRQNLKHLILC